MSTDPRRTAIHGIEVDRIGALARRVIEKLGKRPDPKPPAHIVEAAVWLADLSISPETLGREDVMNHLRTHGLQAADVVDHCIPEAARILGAGWVEDRISFAHVTLGSARLFGLCKSLSADWELSAESADRKAVLLAVCAGGEHTIGAAVLADQIRRRGDSVVVMTAATSAQIAARLRADAIDVVMLSCAEEEGLDRVSALVRDLRARLLDVPPIVLGGAIIAGRERLLQRTGVDLVTNDLSLALSSERQKSKEKSLATAHT